MDLVAYATLIGSRWFSKHTCECMCAFLYILLPMKAGLYFFLNRSWRNGRKSTALSFITESDTLMAVLGRPLRVDCMSQYYRSGAAWSAIQCMVYHLQARLYFFLNRSRRNGRKKHSPAVCHMPIFRSGRLRAAFFVYMSYRRHLVINFILIFIYLKYLLK